MNKTITLLILLAFVIQLEGQAQKNTKPIVIITQDGEVDDRSSFIRFLLYTSDMDLRGIIATNSIWQKNGHGTDWIMNAIDKYGKVRDNLILHNPNYPTVDFLKSITVHGNEDPQYLKGEPPYSNSEGADLIIRELVKDEIVPIHVNCWGGVNTVAHALWKLKNNYSQQAYEKAVSRIRIYCITFQDDGGNWIKTHVPEAMIIEAGSWFLSWTYHEKEQLQHNPYPEVMSENWLNNYVKIGHGPLGAIYPQKNISESDTPAFLNFVDNGLNAHEDYSYGGWGGRFQAVEGNYWKDAADDNNTKKSLWRWCPETQNDFAARMDWCVNPFNSANHPPIILSTTEAREVMPGDKVVLTASLKDPDENRLYVWWWNYKEPSGLSEQIMIHNETSINAHFFVPNDIKNDIHIILEVKDDGAPSLMRYKRLIFKVLD